MFADLGPESKTVPEGLQPAEAKEKGGFSYVELNEKSPGLETANKWASGLASGLAAAALTPFGPR